MDTLIPAFLRRQRNQRRLTLEMLSAKVGMSPQHLSEIESGKRDPRLSSIERMAEAMGMTVLIVPEAMAPELRRYVAHNGRTYTTKTFHRSRPGQLPQRPRPPPPEATKPEHVQAKNLTRPLLSPQSQVLSPLPCPSPSKPSMTQKPATPPSTAVSAATGRTKKPWMR
jgi:transcriptional regulator with XRE-family HTH domain